MGPRFDILTFLEEYQRFPCLWRKNSTEFKNRVKRDHAEELLLPLSGLSTIKELRYKIRSIRCTYNQEVAKVKKSMGTDSSQVYTPKLSWFSFAESFLKCNDNENESESNLTLPDDNSEAKQMYEVPTAETVEPTQERKHSPATQSTTTVSVVKSKISRKRPARSTRRLQVRKQLDDSLENVVEVLKQLADRSLSANNNEFTSFGQHIASQLQCLPLEDTLTLRDDIQKLITAARLRCIQRTKNSNISKPISPCDVCQTIISNSSDVLSDTSSSPVMDRARETVDESHLMMHHFQNLTEENN